MGDDPESEANAKKLIAEAETALAEAEKAHRDAVADAAAADADAEEALIAAMKLAMYFMNNPGNANAQQDAVDALDEAASANSNAADAKAKAQSTQTVGTDLFLRLAKVALSRGENEKAESLAKRALIQSKKVKANASDAHIDRMGADGSCNKAKSLLDRYPAAK